MGRLKAFRFSFGIQAKPQKQSKPKITRPRLKGKAEVEDERKRQAAGGKPEGS